MTFEDLSRSFATFYRRTFCWIHGCSLLFFLTMTNQQQQFLQQQFFRQEQQPQQWAYYFHGGQTAQPQQQPQQQHYQFVYSPERRQFQLLPIQQNQPTSTPQFSAFQQQSTGNSQFQQPQQFFPQQQQQQQFQPQFQQQFPQSTQTQFPVFQQNNFPQNQFSQSPQNQFQQPQFQQEQQTTQAAFQQPLADQQQLPDWFVRSSGPGEFQGELPELIRPPMIHHVQREQDLPSLSRPAPPAPPTQQQQQQQFAFPTQPQQQIQPPVPPPRIVHIQPEQLQSNEAQQIHELLPQLLLSTQRPTTRRPPTTTTARRTRRPTTPRTLTRAPPTPPPAILIKEETKPPSVEFAADLPPPPPARFLPESEKVRIAELIRQNNRIRNNQAIHAGAITDFPTLATKPPPPPPTPASTKPPTRKSTLARLAVQEATTFVPVDIAGGQKDPNRVFLDCCRRKRVAKICESRCNFDVLNKKILTGMFLGSDKCPTEFGLDLFTCAAQDSDHTTCCREKRVHTTGAGDKCLAFCNLAPEAPRIQLDASYLPCWAVLNEVKTCFRDNIVG